jgi:hypothetical protein
LGLLSGFEMIKLIDRKSTLYNIYFWIRSKIKINIKKNIDYTEIDPFGEEDWEEKDYV